MNQPRYNLLNDMQQKAVFQTEGPVLILAGAGSGKTRVLTHRIAYLIEEKHVPSWHILAITFTNKAAREMKERAEKLAGDEVRDALIATFHSACLRILKREAKAIGYTSRFTIYDPEDQKALVKRILKELNISDKMYTPKAILAEISRAKDELVTPEKYEEKVGYQDLFRKKTAMVYREYQKALVKDQAMDFDDLINNTIRLFKENPDILDKYQERFRYIMVDEYQDTNTAQYQLVRILSGKYRNLCVVGDDDQSIYKFRGANIRNILDFEKDYKDAMVIRLEQNYRSTSKILNAANVVIRNNEGRKEKTLWTQNPEGENIKVCGLPDENSEGYYVASVIRDLTENQPYHYSDFAILYRANAQSRALEEKLVMASVPYHLFGGTPFYQRREIKDLMCYLRLIANDHDYAAGTRIINVPGRGIGDATTEKLRLIAEENGAGITQICQDAWQYPELKRAEKKLNAFAELIFDLRTLSEEESIEKLIHHVVERTGYDDYLLKDDPLKIEDRRENMNELAARAHQYENDEDRPEEERSLDGFLDELALVAAIDDPQGESDQVAMMTLHSAKGLEFPVVFITGLEEGLFPSYLSVASGNEEDLEEERRLMYVGITRAEKKLYLTYANNRMLRGERSYTRRSRFLDELPPEILDEEESNGEDTSVRAGQTGMFYKEGRTSAYPVHPVAKRPVQSFDTSVYGGAIPKSKAPAFDVNQSKPPVERLEVGDTVMHSRFGLGTVTEVKSVNADYQVRVNFAKVGEKLLFAKMARLKKV